MEKFKELGIIEPILRAIKDAKFQEPSGIQKSSVPLVISGKDIIAGSATGSGKTLVFGVGIIQNCTKGNGIQSLVLTPTRELAEQNAKSLIQFSKYKPLDIVAIYGGVSINPQISRLRNADVVIGTPGRILDHLSRGTIFFDKVKILVLDEADRMLDMGFLDDVSRIIGKCPRQRQTLLFSATITTSISNLAERYMRAPEKVSAEAFVDPRKLKQVYYNAGNLKFSLLVHLLKQKMNGLAMIFCNSRQNVDFVVNNLNMAGIKAQAIHGGFSQDQRNRTIESFNSKASQILVCTDVAARGLDIRGISHVYNYDLPKESKQYIHRIGRTARAGDDGIAVNLLSERDHDNFSRVLRDFDVKVAAQDMPYVQRVRTFVNKGQRFGYSPKGSFGRRNHNWQGMNSFHKR